MGDDYEILPHEELEYLRKEVERLKADPFGGTKSSDTLMGSMDKLNANVERLVRIFETAEDEVIKDYRENRPAQKLVEVMDQNERLAKGMVAIAELVKEMQKKMNEQKTVPPVVRSAVPQSFNQAPPVVRSAVPQSFNQAPPVVRSAVPQSFNQAPPVVRSAVPQSFNQVPPSMPIRAQQPRRMPNQGAPIAPKPGVSPAPPTTPNPVAQAPPNSAVAPVAQAVTNPVAPTAPAANAVGIPKPPGVAEKPAPGTPSIDPFDDNPFSSDKEKK